MLGQPQMPNADYYNFPGCSDYDGERAQCVGQDACVYDADAKTCHQYHATVSDTTIMEQCLLAKTAPAIYDSNNICALPSEAEREQCTGELCREELSSPEFCGLQGKGQRADCMMPWMLMCNGGRMLNIQNLLQPPMLFQNLECLNRAPAKLGRDLCGGKDESECNGFTTASMTLGDRAFEYTDFCQWDADKGKCRARGAGCCSHFMKGFTQVVQAKLKAAQQAAAQQMAAQLAAAQNQQG